MTDKIDETLKGDLLKCLETAFADEDVTKRVNKAVDDVVYRLKDNLEYAVKDELAGELAGWVADMAARAVNQILEGNEDQMRRYLSCEKRAEDGTYRGWTGRSDGEYWGRRDPAFGWHPVIHGELFEQGAVELRKKIVDAHRDVLVNERIRDLEDQVKSLVAQVNKAIAEKDAMWERFRHVA